MFVKQKKIRTQTMKLFRPLRKLIPFLVGYDILKEYDFKAPNAFRKYLCDFTSLLGYFVLVSGTILVGGFLVIDAKTFEEIHDHSYEFATGLNDTFYFVYIHWMCKHFFYLSNYYEQIIRKR